MKTGKIINEGDCPILKAVMNLDIDKKLLYYLYTNEFIMNQAKNKIVVTKERFEQIPGLENVKDLKDLTEYDRIIGMQIIHGWEIDESLDNETIGTIELPREKFLSIQRGYQIKSIEYSLERLKELNE